MKLRVKALSLILIAVAIGAWTCNALAATATGSFNYDFTLDVPCTGTLTDCVDHFEIWDVTNGTNIKLATVVTPTTNLTATTPVPFSFKVGPPYGTRTWSAVAVTKNGTKSDPALSTAPVNVKPGAPAAFVVNLN